MKKLINMMTCRDQERLTDQSFMRAITISVIGICICLIGLCSATWAWFSYEINLPSNSIQAGNYELTVQVNDEAHQTVSGETRYEGAYTYTLEPEIIYTVELSPENMTANGYCRIYFEGFYEPLLTDVISSLDGGFYFLVRVSQRTRMTLEPRWGTVAYGGDVKRGETVLCESPDQEDGGISVIADYAPVFEETESAEETTAPEETEPEVTEALPEPEETAAPEESIAETEAEEKTTE